MSFESDKLCKSLVKDVLIFGQHNNWQRIKQRLLKGGELSFDKVLKICTSIGF